MILERKTALQTAELKEEFGDILNKAEDSEETNTLNTLIHLVEMQHVYSAAMNEISTKLEILDDEFQVSYKHNPIHHLECRVKNPRSLLRKMEKRKLPLSVEAAKTSILDIAGIRVICNYIEDIYTIERLLLKQTDVKLLTRKDYIEKPKENGYRSLHLVVSIPVFLSNSTEVTPVEIQIRTTAMDMWASLEHKLKYKNEEAILDQHVQKLKQCSLELAKIENDLQEIHQDISTQQQ